MLSRNVASNIIKEKTTSDLLKALSNMYEKLSAMDNVYLVRRLFNLQMSEGGSVADHINEFNMIVSQLSLVEINFEDENKALILISSLPMSWDTVVAAINRSRESNKLKFDEIQNVVLSESIANEKLKIHLVVLSVLTNGKEVNRRAQTKGNQNQRVEKNLQIDQT